MTNQVFTPILPDNITAPRVPFLDPRTPGLISREWFRWFLTMFAQANQSAEFDKILASLAVAPLETDPSQAIRDAVYEGSLLAPIQSNQSQEVPPLIPDYVGPATFTQDIPNLGGLVTLLVSAANVTQQLTNVDTTVAFNVDSSGSFGSMKRVGNTFSSNLRETYVFIFEPQVRQDKNNNVTNFWVNINGTAVQGTGVTYETTAINDSNVVSLTFAGILAPGDVVTFHAITSIIVGSTLLATAAAPPVPNITAVRVTILGYKT
jgi:hypothetical protein